jgi:leucyl aminopeptidase
MIKITISKEISSKIGYTIIPLLLTNLDSESLFKYVSRYTYIPESYKMLLEQIENNMKHNNLNMTSFTIEKNNGSRTILNKKTKSKSKSSSKTISKTKLSSKLSLELLSKIHQIFIIAINNRSYNNSKYNELLEIARITGNAIFNTLKSNQIKSINIIDTIDGNYDNDNTKIKSLTNSISGNTKFIEAMIEGLCLSSYKFLKYKTDKALTNEKDNFILSNVNVVIPNYWKNNNKLHNNEIISRFIELQNQIKSVFLARDLINEPANKAKSEEFINIIKKTIEDNKLPITIEILNKKDLEKMGMGLILSVGSGSSIENEPRVLIMKYNGSRAAAKSPEYVLLGKGITFDTGGLDIKGSHSIYEMKTDMSGAATVASFLVGYAMNKGSKCIYTICPFAENSVGPNSTKPSDVVKSYNGRTVEIADTDAEGRLILADCLAYVVDKYPEAIIIDFATLTGQQEKLSCKLFSNILSVNSQKEVEKLIASSKEINELLVELPIIEKQLKNLESYVADIKNVSFTCSADIIMSSLFMRQFVKKNTKWMHIDIAGPSYKANEAIKYASPEASGVGVRLLFAYFD